MTRRFAGMGGHQSARARTDVWLTPPSVLEALGGWESFDLDPCAPAQRPWPMARHHYTAADDGLDPANPWFGRVWCNPPYRRRLLPRFLGRMVQHGIGTALIFARTETATWFHYVWDHAAAVLFIAGRLNFCDTNGRPIVRKNGKTEANAGAPSALCAYGFRDAEILGDCGIPGKFVPLLLPRSFAVIAFLGAEQTWREIVVDLMRKRRGPVPLDELYRALSQHPKANGRRHYQAKIRQVLQQGPFKRVAPGLWEARA